MATTDATAHDALLMLRQSAAAKQPCIPTTTEDPSSASDVDLSLATASYLYFPLQKVSLPLTSPTRFILSDKPVDLRSIYLAFHKSELGISEYHAFVATCNAELAAAKPGESVVTLSFVERLDLITYLDSESEESEFVKPLAADVANAAAAAKIASGAVAGSTAANIGLQDSRLTDLYNGERKMGDRNTVLRGVKPTVCCSYLECVGHTDCGRTSHMYESLQRSSARRRVQSLLHRMALHYRSTRKLQFVDQILSSSSHLQLPLYYECQISNHSSKAVFSHQQIRQQLHHPPPHRYYIFSA